MDIPKWRQNWLSSINELSSLKLQLESWLDMSNTNPHWSFVEFISCYFDDLLLEDDYANKLKKGYITKQEYEIVINWHRKLSAYSCPNGNNYDHQAILNDLKWIEIIDEGVEIKNELRPYLQAKELHFLDEEIDHLAINDLDIRDKFSNEKINALFVCTMNKWRSKTAESIFSKSNSINVKSAGTSNSARIKINRQLIEWAEVVFVMEEKHKDQIVNRFNLDSSKYKFVNLNIEDNYKYMDKELVKILKDELEAYIASR